MIMYDRDDNFRFPFSSIRPMIPSVHNGELIGDCRDEKCAPRSSGIRETANPIGTPIKKWPCGKLRHTLRYLLRTVPKSFVPFVDCLANPRKGTRT